MIGAGYNEGMEQSGHIRSEIQALGRVANAE